MNKIFTLIALGLITSPAHAEVHKRVTDGFFIGAKAGFQQAYDDSIDNDPSGGAYGLFGGYQFNKNWSWDLEYQSLGSLEANDVTNDTSLFETGIKYDYLFDESNWSLFGRLGAAWWEMEKSTPNASWSADGVSPILSAGVGYLLSPRWEASAAYQLVPGIGDDSTGQFDSNALMLGLTYKFGNMATAYEQPMQQEQPIEEAQEKVAPPPVKKPVELEKIRLKAHFRLGEKNQVIAEDKAHLRTDLEKVNTMMQNHPELQVTLIGHADSSGSKEYNQWISKQRAKTIAAKLESMGAPSSRIHIRGVGESEARGKYNISDRRVDILLDCSQCKN